MGEGASDYLLSQKDAAQAYARALGDRIRECRGQLTRKEFGDKLQLHINTVGKLERGETLPDAFLLTLIAGIGNCPIEWLVTGHKRDRAAWGVSKQLRAVEVGDFVYVPHFNVDAAAGKSELFSDIETIKAMRPFDRAYIRGELAISHEDLVLINVNGDSMEPSLHSKDTIMIDLRSRDVYSEGVHVIRIDDALLIKRVQRLPGKVLRISSENQDYEPFEIRPNEDSTRDFEVIGRVMWGGVTFK